MVKVKVENITPAGTYEIIHLTVLSEEDGPCGSFRLIERNPEKMNKHTIGEEFQLIVKPLGIIDTIKEVIKPKKK